MCLGILTSSDETSRTVLKCFTSQAYVVLLDSLFSQFQYIKVNLSVIPTLLTDMRLEVVMQRKKKRKRVLKMPVFFSLSKGKLMNVQLSTSRLRTVPGMGDHAGCYVCGKPGHWSKDCPRGQNGSYGDGGGFRGGRGYPPGPPGFGRGGPGYGGGPGMLRVPPDYMGSPMYGRVAGYPGASPMSRHPGYAAARDYGSDGREQYGGRSAMSYPDRSAAYERDRYSATIDYYEKYRARPYSSSYADERRLSIPPPPLPPSSAALSRMRLSSSLDAYDRPLAGAASAASAASASYYARDRSPIRRVSGGGSGASSSYAYERSRLSPVSRSSSYAVSRSREAYGERARYAY